MLQYTLLIHCIVTKIIYQTGKQTAYIAKLHKTGLIKVIFNTLTYVAVLYRDTSRVSQYFDVSIRIAYHYI